MRFSVLMRTLASLWLIHSIGRGALAIYPNCYNVWTKSFKTIPTDFLLSPLNRLDLGVVENWQAHTFMDNNTTINRISSQKYYLWCTLIEQILRTSLFLPIIYYGCPIKLPKYCIIKLRTFAIPIQTPNQNEWIHGTFFGICFRRMAYLIFSSYYMNAFNQFVPDNNPCR